MSVEVNENELSIEIKETMSFKYHVQNTYDSYVEEVNERIEDEDYTDEDERNKMTEFVNHILTDEDKVDILKSIADDYDYESYQDGGVSIFDEDLIGSSVKNWIEDKFDFFM